MRRIIDCTEPDESFVPLDFFRSSHSQIQDTRELAISVYRAVWDEFYAWEKHDSATTIASHSRRPAQDVADHFDPDLAGLQDLDIDSDCATSHFLVTEYDETGTDHASFRSPCVKIPFQPSFDPHPPYQVCTPIARNIFWRDGDPDDQFCVPFIPYADEQTFDAIQYLQQFDFSNGYPTLEWQTMVDPDHEMIQLETIRRLHFVHNLTFSQIDDSGEGLFADRTRRGNEAGIIWSCSQRDELKWSGNSLAPFPQLPASHAPDVWDVQERLNSIIRTFCPNLNCVESHCSVHVSEQSDVEVSAPTILNSSFRLTLGNPCDRDCFRHEDDDFVEKVSWDPEDKTSPAIVKLFPELAPCELAVLCRRSCREVFALRCHMFPDHQINTIGIVSLQKEQIIPDEKFFVDVQDSTEFTPLMQACNHKGSCAEGTCPCYERRVHCQRNCCCGFDCVLRWKGCKCKLKNISGYVRGAPTCGPKKCPCHLAHKECDPELCSSCDARHAIAGIKSRRCSNVVIQRDQPGRLEIKKGAVGLGAFSTHIIQENDYLGEYVGESYNDGDLGGDKKMANRTGMQENESETIPDEDDNNTFTDPRDFVRRYTGHNYLFSLNGSQSLDSDRVGNETRYFNHKEVPNAEVKIFLVNNEHRIGFFAKEKIQKGSELFISYGEGYWLNGVQPKDI